MAYVLADSFLKHHPVFSKTELTNFLFLNGYRNKRAGEFILRYNVQKGKLKRIKNNLYAVTQDKNAVIGQPSYLIASKATHDALLACHSALELYGLKYSIFLTTYFFTNTKIQPFKTQNYQFNPVPYPKALVRKGLEGSHTTIRTIYGLPIRVPTLERVIVDVFYNIECSGGWEEVWRSLEFLRQVDFEKILEYALLLEDPVLIGLLGYYFEKKRSYFKIHQSFLDSLQEYKPKYPQYTYLSLKGSFKIIEDWNIIIPLEVYEQRWDEFSIFGNELP